VSLRISETVVWQSTADGISLYHTETGDFRTLNETAARIWELVDTEGELEAVVSRLSREYAGSNHAISSRVRADIEEFLALMVKDGLMART
jgi:hypothetical protein